MRTRIVASLLLGIATASPAQVPTAALLAPSPTGVPAGSAAIEQTRMGADPAPVIVAAFEGLGASFRGPHGPATLRNPSDNSLAVGRDHILQTVNSRMAVFTKAGARYDTTGQVLYGPVNTNNMFRGFGGACESNNNGDAVVRYDQLVDRWLLVMPIFRRVRPRTAPPGPRRAVLFVPPEVPPPAATPTPAPPATTGTPPARPPAVPPVPADSGAFAMCYAISTTADPFGPWDRYEFDRTLFPDYPRPAVWPDGYYTPTSTGDEVIEKHVCVVDRRAMLAGEDATEQCIIVPGVNFLNTSDLDGRTLPPPGAPNIVVAAGGSQLKGIIDDDALFAWRFHVDWTDSTKTRLDGPQRLAVAPYRYLCGGQLTNCVPQPGVERRLDAQGDKIMARLVYRRFATHEALVAVHSVNTVAGGGGVRWYELRVAADRALTVHQQGTFAPDSLFRWMASPAVDRLGNIGIGYSFGGATHFPGQRFAGRTPSQPLGMLGSREAILVDGAASQTTTLRWEDYTQTAIDPTDDCTIWYVGDYLRAGDTQYSSRIGAFRMPGCGTR
jgi:hypothetical protein